MSFQSSINFASLDVQKGKKERRRKKGKDYKKKSQMSRIKASAHTTAGPQPTEVRAPARKPAGESEPRWLEPKWLRRSGGKV